MTTSEPKTRLSPEEVCDLAVEILLDRKAYDILVLDISKCSDLADYMVICSARNARQTQAIAAQLSERLKKAGVRRVSVAGTEVGSWVVLDYGDVFIHVMQTQARSYYDLEALWGDAKTVKKLEGEKPRGLGDVDDVDAEPDESDEDDDGEE